MKRIIICAVLCLLTSWGGAAQNIDDETLTLYLVDNFYADESMPWERIDGFKERFAVTDDQLHRVLMSLYNEADGKRATLTPKTQANRGQTLY